MSGGRKRPLSQISGAAERLRDMLAPSCERIEFAGSLRRAGAGDPLIGDLELVAIPAPARLRFGIPADRQANALESRLAELIDQNVIRRRPVDMARGAWGPKYKKFWIPVGREWLQVDLFLADVQNFGAIFTIRTGSDSYSQSLVTHIRDKTPYRQQDGYIIRQATGEIVPVPDESDYFDLAGVQWIPVVKRTGPAALVIVRDYLAEADQVPSSDAQSGGQLALF